MAETKFGALKGLKDRTLLQTPEPERPHKAGAGEGVEAKRGPGRPAGGKRSNPDFERLNLLIRKTTRRKVDMKMLQEPDSAADLSELVERLLVEWAT